MLRLRSRLGVTGSDCNTIHPEAPRLTTGQCGASGGQVTSDGQFCRFPEGGCSLIDGYMPLSERGSQGPARLVGPGVSYPDYSQNPQQYQQQHPYQPLYSGAPPPPPNPGAFPPGQTMPPNFTASSITGNMSSMLPWLIGGGILLTVVVAMRK